MSLGVHVKFNKPITTKEVSLPTRVLETHTFIQYLFRHFIDQKLLIFSKPTYLKQVFLFVKLFFNTLKTILNAYRQRDFHGINFSYY